MTSSTRACPLVNDYKLLAKGPEKRKLGLELLNKQLKFLVRQTDVDPMYVPTEAAVKEIGEALKLLKELLEDSI